MAIMCNSAPGIKAFRQFSSEYLFYIQSFKDSGACFADSDAIFEKAT